MVTRNGSQIRLLNRKGHVWVHALGRFLQELVCGGNSEVRKSPEQGDWLGDHRNCPVRDEE